MGAENSVGSGHRAEHSGPAVRVVGVAVCVCGFIAAVDCP